MSEEKLPDKPEGYFSCFEDWVNTASRRIGGTNSLCVDSKDRVCRMGKDMMKARDESAFPVRYYFGLKNIQTYIR